MPGWPAACESPCDLEQVIVPELQFSYTAGSSSVPQALDVDTEPTYGTPGLARELETVPCRGCGVGGRGPPELESRAEQGLFQIRMPDVYENKVGVKGESRDASNS